MVIRHDVLRYLILMSIYICTYIYSILTLFTPLSYKVEISNLILIALFCFVYIIW